MVTRAVRLRGRRAAWPWLRPAAAPRIEFLCRPEDRGVIAEPYPAREKLPAWFRKLPPVDKGVESPTNNGLTVKRCMPFFDALCVGWILPVAATFRLEVRDNGRTVDAGWEFDRTLQMAYDAGYRTVTQFRRRDQRQVAFG